jgi:hypothetical protein
MELAAHATAVGAHLHYHRPPRVKRRQHSRDDNRSRLDRSTRSSHPSPVSAIHRPLALLEPGVIHGSDRIQEALVPNG